MITFLVNFFLIFSNVAQAGIESASTLPKGVTSPEIGFGFVTGLNEKFNSNGDIINVTDAYHMNLTGTQISKFDSSGQAQQLVGALNSLVNGMGNQLSLGTIDFKANPSVDYMLINPAYGLKKNLAVGFGFPIIHYRNEMEIVSSGYNNIQAIRTLAGPLSAELEDGLNKLYYMSYNLPATIQNIITSKGYKPISSMEYTAFGDVQIYGRYKYFENSKWRFAVRPYFLAPTGRGDDPDDLSDYAIGGYTAIGSYFANEYFIRHNLISSLVLQYQAHLPDRIDRRVPNGSDDILPGIDRKENVNRFTGNIFDIILAQKFSPKKWVTICGFYDFATKDPDNYSGDRGYDYGILSRDTGYQTHKFGGYIEFDTTNYYFEKKFALPFLVGYTYTNTFAAINSPKTSTHLFNLRMFF